MVFSPTYRITDGITVGIAQIERARGFLEGATLSAGWLAAQREKAFVREAHHTTHIEGTQLTLDQAERILKGEQVRGADPDDVQEVINYRSAFELVSANPRLSEALIREIHAQLVQKVRGGSAAPGEYRRVQNYVVNSRTGQVIYTPPAAFEVPQMMAELIDWLRASHEAHPVILAGIAQFQFVHIHPFLDGNGRTARLLSTLCLYNAGYDFKQLFSISEYYDRDRPAYYTAIQSVRQNGLDLTQWLKYFVLGLTTQLEEVQDRARQTIDLGALAAQFDLTDRQRKILEVVQSHQSMGIHDLVLCLPQVSERTIQRDLKFLIDKGLIAQEGAARRARYFLP